MKIPLCIPNIDENEINLVTDVLKSGWLAHGPKNEELQEKFSKYMGVKHAVPMNSCTSALQLAIIGSELKGEIILPSFTFVAPANAIVTSGCKPVFCEVDFNTRNIDPKGIEKKITKKTVGIMPIHYGGQSCVMDEIMEIAEKHDLTVIEDSAESIGAEFNGKKTGSFDIGCFSFFPTKNMTTGEGGMLTTDDDELAQKVRAYIGHGIATSTWIRERKKDEPWLRDAVLPGYNFRMCDILAAVGIKQLDKLDNMNDMRRKHSKYLNKSLVFDGIKTPVEMPEAKHVYQMYTITLDTANFNRIKFISKLKELDVGASVHFDPPVHMCTYYREKYGFMEGDMPITEKLANSIVTLPMFPRLTGEQLDYMVDAVEKALNTSRK